MPDNCYPTIIPTIDNSELECCDQINSQCVIHPDELPTLSLPEDSDLRTILNEIDTYLSSGGVSTFLELTDTPSLYTGEAGNFTRVNVGETALEFFTLADVAISNDYNDLDNLPSVIQPTGLEAIDEGNGIGWRLIGRDPLRYGNIGLDAIDISFSTGNSSTRGATGQRSFAQGVNVIASGAGSVAMGSSLSASGNNTQAFGDFSIASGSSSFAGGSFGQASGVAAFSFGSSTESTANYAVSFNDRTNATGLASFAIGSQTTAGGEYSFSQGAGSFASGFGSSAFGNSARAYGVYSQSFGVNSYARAAGEFAIGVNGTDYTANSPNDFNALDRVFNVGNGTISSQRRNAFTIFKNGASLFVPIDKSTVANGTKGMYIYDSVDDEPKYHDGTNWNSFGVGQVDSVVAGTNITVDNTDPANPIVSAAGSVGEANTYSNLGAGTGIIGTKSGVDLRFKTLVEGSNITLTSDANTVTISTDEGQIEETASFILSDATHNNKVVIVNNGATNITITVNTSLSNNFRAGFVQHGTGTVTFVASGTTLRSANGLIIDGQYNQAFIQKRNAGTNEFHVLGNLTT